jgi:putative two-component system response regulator
MHVMIIDDNPMSLDFMARLVTRIEECTALCFQHPEEALAAITSPVPDVILLDQVMPAMDGLTVLRHIRAHPQVSDVPVIMVTADDSNEMRIQALDAGASDFLNKPVRVPELRARLRNLLKLRQSQKLLHDRAALLADQVDSALAEVRERELELLTRLCKAAEFRDPDTGAHIDRMSRYSLLIAQALGLPADECRAIQLAAPLHDVGKLGIPDAILLKPGRLNDEEMAVMRRHPDIGYSILKESRSPLIRLGAAIAHSHHEKWDGSGYPAGMGGDAIPLAGRIVAVADVFDALTTGRPYKRAWEPDEAHRFLLDGRGRHFDPACLDAFFGRWNDILEVRRTMNDPLPDDLRVSVEITASSSLSFCPSAALREGLRATGTRPFPRLADSQKSRAL